jgi:hypothetical protein
MANPNFQFGFRPVIRMGGSPFSVTEYGKAAADVNPIYAFDLVGHLTGGTPMPLPENPTYNLSRIQDGSQLTPGTSLWLGASMSYGAPSTATVHPVTDEIDCVFLAACGPGATVITTAAHAGLNALVKLVAGNPATKMSKSGVDDANIAVTAGYDLKIRGIAMIPPNVEGPNAIVEVLINKHALGQATAAV